MDSNKELPPDHFWDTEEAEREYCILKQVVADAEAQQAAKLADPQSRLLALASVYSYFTTATQGALVLPDEIYSTSRALALSRPDWKQRSYEHLNDMLNPYWYPYYRIPDGHARCDFQQGKGQLKVQSVERKTITDAVDYDRHFTNIHIQKCTLPYSYEERIERYVPTGDAAVSEIEHFLLQHQESAAAKNNSRYAALLGEVVREVHSLLAPLMAQLVLTFRPELAPTNVKDISQRYYVGKYDKPQLDFPPLTRYEAPKVGEVYGPSSYKGIQWLACGRWEPHQFTKEQLAAVREGLKQLEQRLARQIAEEAFSEIVAGEETVYQLRRRMDAVRILHYKPLVLKEFWSAMQITGR